MKSKLKSIEGITLIALVVTIVVLIILTAITMTFIIGQNGIVERAKKSTQDYQTAQENEAIKLNEASDYIVGSRDTVTIDKEEYENLKRAIPTGIKTDIYVRNSYNNKASYSEKNTMNAFTKENDPENKISEYLSYSDKGYTVLKSGWYFIKTYVEVGSSSACDLYMRFVLNGKEIINATGWTSGGIWDRDQDVCPIYLNESDIVYFASYADGGTANNRIARGEINPMF